MTEIAIGPYEPDIASIGTAKNSYVKNVVPRADGYGPMRGFTPFAAALPDRCLGFFGAMQSDGSTAIFAGTTSKLYRLDATARTWTDVSKAGGYTVAAKELWSFTQFGDNVIAVTSNAAPQVYALGSSSAFADLGGSPPQARRVSVVNDFLVLSSLTAHPNQIAWSAINDITGWTFGTASSDFQQFPDGGFVRGACGGEYGLVFQDSAIRRMIYAPGTPYVFEFSKVSEDRGLAQPYSLVKAHQSAFFLSQDGFYRIDPGGPLIGIGANKVNRTVLADADLTNPRFMIGCADPRANRVYWAYKSRGNLNASYLDKLLVYDWSLDRWSIGEMGVTFLAPAIPLGVTLESLDAVYPNLDTMPFSLDVFETTPVFAMAGVDRNGQAGFFDGDTLEAIMDTPEGTIGAGVRTFVASVAPLTDAPSVYVKMGRRERIMDAISYTPETTMSARSGYAPQRSSGRYQTARLRIPAGIDWTFARSVEVDATKEGLR